MVKKRSFDTEEDGSHVEGATIRIEEGLLERPTGKITIDVETTEGPFDRVYTAVLVSVKLLEVIVNEVVSLGITHARGSIVRARIIALGTFDHAMWSKIRTRLDHSSWHYFLSALCAAALTTIRFGVNP